MEFTLKELMELNMLDIGEWFNIPVDKNKHMLLRTVDTGISNVQTIANSKDVLPFRYIGHEEGKIQLISEPIEMPISFYGKIGFKNVEKILGRISKELIESEDVKAKAVQKDDWRALPEWLRYGSYILATKKKKEIMGGRHNGVYIVQDGILYVEYLSTSYQREYKISTHAIRVIATILMENSNVKVRENERMIDGKYMCYDVIST